MGGFDVVIEQLRKAAKAAGSAGEQAGAVDLGGTVSGVAGALPGSRSATTVGKTAEAWRAQVKEWSGRVSRHGTSLTTAADHYAANEEAAAQDLSNVAQGR